jgi:glycosyltransferase involved in cell wall biosynthesis
MKVLHLETGRSLYGGALQVLYLLEGLQKSADLPLSPEENPRTPLSPPRKIRLSPESEDTHPFPDSPWKSADTHPNSTPPADSPRAYDPLPASTGELAEKFADTQNPRLGTDPTADTHELVTPPGTALAAAARERGFRVHEVPFHGDLDFAAVLRLRRLFRRRGADLVHLHSRRGADLLGALAARWTPVPAVLSRRVDEPERAILLRLKTRLAARVVAISQAVRSVLVEAGVPDADIEVIPSAVDTDRYAPDPAAGTYLRRTLGIHRDETVVGMAAQFIPRKGHRVLLQALPEVIARHPRTRFVLFGQGAEEETIRSLSRGTPAGEHLLFAGFREDLPDLLPGLDLLVHPALREGLGVILLQAAACAVPAVASRAGGMPEVVRHAETGLLVPPDDPQALARALHDLLDDPEWCHQLGQSARRRALEHFSLPSLARRHQALYHRLLTR